MGRLLLLLEEKLGFGLLVLLLNLDKLFLENLNLLSILSEEGILRVFVHFRLIFNSLRPVCIAQSAQSFFVARLRWRDIGYHASLHVSTERVL